MKLILGAILTMFFAVANAQSGLQFNQVVLATVPLAATTGSTANVGTVPAGKVWKLENFISDGDLSAAYVNMHINGGAAKLPIPTSTYSSSVMNTDAFWFPAGTGISLQRVNTVASGITVYFSIIEFTVVP
jgi:hypothetical protein